MTTEKQIADFGTTEQGSRNAGEWYAKQNQPLPAPQPFESWTAYANRQSAYNEAQKKSGS